MEGGLVPVVVPGAAVADLVACLEELEVVGSAVAGPALGLDDVAVARLVGVAEQDVRDHLVARWPGAVVGDEAEEAYRLCWPVMTVGAVRTVAVTPPADLMLSVMAKRAGVTFHEARVGEHLLVGLVDDPKVPVDVLVPALVNAKGRSVVLWRTEHHTGLHVLRRGKHAESHLWEPPWQPVGPAGPDDPRELGIVGDATAIGALLGLSSSDVVALRAMMRLPAPDLSALADLLGLPVEVVDVLEARTTVAELPGGTATEPGSWRQEIAASLAPSEHDPALIRFIDRGSRELRPWYVVASVLTIVLGAGLVLAWADGASAFRGVVGLVAALGTAIDLAARWWRRRRRSTAG